MWVIVRHSAFEQRGWETEARELVESWLASDVKGAREKPSHFHVCTNLGGERRSAEHFASEALAGVVCGGEHAITVGLARLPELRLQAARQGAGPLVADVGIRYAIEEASDSGRWHWGDKRCQGHHPLPSSPIIPDRPG